MVHGKNRIPYWIDRRLTGLAGPEYHAIISFGLPIAPEDSQYGKYRLRLWLVGQHPCCKGALVKSLRSLLVAVLGVGLAILLMGACSIAGGNSSTTFKSSNTLSPASSESSGTVAGRNRIYAPSPTPNAKADTTGFSDVLVWRFCSSSFQGETTPEQLSLVIRLDEDALIKENAKRVHRLVMAMYEAQPRVDVGLLKQTYEACEKWRDDDWAESQSK